MTTILFFTSLLVEVLNLPFLFLTVKCHYIKLLYHQTHNLILQLGDSCHHQQPSAWDSPKTAAFLVDYCCEAPLLSFTPGLTKRVLRTFCLSSAVGYFCCCCLISLTVVHLILAAFSLFFLIYAKLYCFLKKIKKINKSNEKSLFLYFE